MDGHVLHIWIFKPHIKYGTLTWQNSGNYGGRKDWNEKTFKHTREISYLQIIQEQLTYERHTH
jgi:hypothetical protein